MIAQALLRNFAAAELQQTANENTHEWNWREGTMVFPEAKCPFCREAIRSNRIWLIEGKFVLRGQLRLQHVGNQYGTTSELRAVLEAPNHPHVSEGSICTGDTDDPVEALFLGMAPMDSFDTSRRTWDTFLKRMFDHECPNIGEWYAANYGNESCECDCDCEDSPHCPIH